MLREEIVENLIKELYGPRNGSDEVIEYNPLEEYLVGALVPKDIHLEPTPENEMILSELPSNEEDENIDTEPIISTPSVVSPIDKQKSFGMAFYVKGEKIKLEVLFTWARYTQTKKQVNKPTSGKKNEKKDKVWKRKFFYEKRDIELVKPDLKKTNIYELKLKLNTSIEVGTEKEEYLIATFRRIQINENLSIIHIFVSNEIDVSGFGDIIGYKKLALVSIFQPSIRVNIIEGEITNYYDKKPFLKEDQILEFLYRNRPILGRGFLCSVIWKEIDYLNKIDIKIINDDIKNKKELEQFLIPDLRTDFLPIILENKPVFDIVIGTNNEEYNIYANELAELWEPTEIINKFSPIIEKYKRWIENNRKIIEKENLGDKEELALEIIKREEQLLSRLEKGLEILKQNKEARLAFCFANKAIWLQNEWKRGKSFFSKRNKNNKGFKWRAFQIFFILYNIVSIVNPQSPDRKITDLLWIPTGGGKTEAYLGLLAFTVAYHRRKTIISKEYPKMIGTISFIRYTLRLLTIQQFRRISRLITAMEFLRVYSKDGKLHGWRPEKSNYNDDWLFGSPRFSVGIWVGGNVTPNSLRLRSRKSKASKNKDFTTAFEALEKNNIDKKTLSNPAQLLNCPACNSVLSVPPTGLDGRNEIYFLIQDIKDIGSDEIKEILSKKASQHKDIVQIELFKQNLKNNYYVVKITLDVVNHLPFFKYIKLIDTLFHDENSEFISILSFSTINPSYFPIYKNPHRKNSGIDQYEDFGVFCLNPSCDLNILKDYGEGVPFSLTDNKTQLPDKFYLQDNLLEAYSKPKMPIPVYTVDEQIYSRIPTVIVSTVDKIARMAFEPLVANLFGYVTNYNKYYGYSRHNMFLKSGVKTKISKTESKEVDFGTAPILIIQDELHLIEGPLGSLFGLYEAMVEKLIKEQNRYPPKYIAATATVKGANDQTMLLFNRPTFLYPPYGINISDRFFIKESRGGRENKAFMGIYNIGVSYLTMQVRIWASLLKTLRLNKNHCEIDYYWTIVSYFNAIRELGGARALYKEDVIERLKEVLGKDYKLSEDKIIELSSRLNSASLPSILSKIENSRSTDIEKKIDAIFTTSMFGTGVDIPHLSLMMMIGQPKTISQYIQATGRVGRNHNGLVLVLYKGGRIRDLSHYELFTGFHLRKYLEVERASVHPYSRGALEKAFGPILVAFLRNYGLSELEWYLDEKPDLILNKKAEEDILKLLNEVNERIQHIDNKLIDTDQIKEIIKKEIEKWKRTLEEYYENEHEEPFVFSEKTLYYKPPEKNVVLGNSSYDGEDFLVVYKRVPYSLREIDDTSSFGV